MFEANRVRAFNNQNNLGGTNMLNIKDYGYMNLNFSNAIVM